MIPALPPGARRRWAGYGLAALLTLAAMVAVQEPTPPDLVQAVARPAGAAGGRPAPATITSPTPLGSAQAQALHPAQGSTNDSLRLALLPDRRLAPALGDPFAAFGPDAAPEGASPGAARAAATAAAPMPPPAPRAPPLPFHFLGRWQEGGQQHVFLQRGDRTLKVGQPGPLDADYAVLAIGEHQITLRYLPLNQVQELRYDAPAQALADNASTAPAATAAQAGTAAADEPEMAEN